MKVIVRLQAQVRQLAGRATIELELPEGSTVTDAIRRLAESGEDALRRLLLTGTAQVQPTLLLFRGDQQVGSADLLEAADELTILSPMAGG